MRLKYLKMMQGLGDTLYLRPFIKYLAQHHRLYIETSWPELFTDIDVFCVRPDNLKLRTQNKNISKNEKYYTKHIPKDIVKEHVHYGPNIQTSNILTELNRRIGIPTRYITMDLDVVQKMNFNKDKPVVVVRPVTERAEWRNIARNPIPEYIEQMTQQLMETHYVISIADLEYNQEWPLQKRMFAHRAYHYGELSGLEVLQYMKSADLLLGGPGFIVPAGIATGVKTVIVCGGQGGYNHPKVISNPYQESPNMHYITPDSFCMCTDMKHRHCAKMISGLMDKFNNIIRG